MTRRKHKSKSGETKGEHTEMRQEFERIARGAAEAENHELAGAAALLCDLLELTGHSEGATEPDELTRSITEFCSTSGLPALRESVGDAGDNSSGLRDLCQDANSRWGEYLSLLAKEDRFEARLRREQPDQFHDGWNAFAGQDEPPEDSDNGADSEFNVGHLLSSLEAISVADTGVNAAPAAASPEAAKKAATPEPVDSVDPELLGAYVDDARQCLSGMEMSVLNLESADDPADSLRQFCRELHTLKGASGIVGLHRLATYLHDLETYVEQITQSGQQPDVDSLLAGVDTVRAQLDALTAGPDASSNNPALSLQIPAAPSAAARQNAQPMPAATAPAAATLSVAPQQVASQPAPQSATTDSSASGEQYVRIEASRLDRMLDLLAELVMLRNRRDTHIGAIHNLEHELGGCSRRIRSLEASITTVTPKTTSAAETESEPADEDALPETRRQHVRSLVELSQDVSELGRTLSEVCDPLSEDNSSVSRLIGEFRQELMELRRLPIGGLFDRLRRVVRDAARTEGKQVELAFEGQGTRAERSLQEQLFEPMMHLVRNAVSHGIDIPEARQAASKSATGTITLAAWSDSATVFIEVRDDGRGLNEKALARRGRELGLVAPGQHLEREELWKLIFHPGFSTRSEVSEISGRGVGMDVVDNWVRRLRGHVEVRSREGQGTTFRIQIPLRSAIEHAMVVRAGGQLFALPMQAVARTSTHQNDSHAEPATSLNSLLGLRQTTTTPQSVLSLRGTHMTDRQTSPTVTETRLAVDAVVGVEEVVIRAMPAMLMRHPLFAGITLSGQAETVLMLDVPRLLAFVGNADETAETTSFGETPAGSEPERGTVLVVDDSLTVRRSIVRRLQANGFTTLESPDGKEALRVLRSEHVAAVVSDIDMPRMDGLDLLAEIRGHSRLCNLPFVVSTSRNDQDTLSRLSELKAERVFHKPMTESDFAELLAALQQSSVVNEPQPA